MNDRIPGLQTLKDEASKLRNGEEGNTERQGRVIAHLADVLIWSIEQGHVSQSDCEDRHRKLRRSDVGKMVILLAPIYVTTIGIAVALFKLIL